MTLTTANPGNIVVTLSSIIEQLQGKLTSSEIDQLLYAIISKRKSEVHAGDLITADLINQILGDLEDLNTRVAVLQGGGGDLGNEDAITTFHDAWRAYGALVKNGSFLPSGTTADAIKSGLIINAYLQDIMYAALAGNVLSYFGGSEPLLDAFQRMYDLQHGLVVLFSAPIAGISDTSTHQQFATQLNAILELNDNTGALSLKNALADEDVDGAIAAQNRINGLSLVQGGDVTTGNLEVIYKGAAGATDKLVIGSTTPTLFNFEVANKTNRSLTANLTASFLPPKAAWTSGISIVGLDGNARSSVTLAAYNPSNPSDAAAKQTVRAAVMVPSGATNGETGVLQFRASAPAPINRSDTAQATIGVSNTATPPANGVLTFSPTTPVVAPNPADATEMIPIGYDFEFSFANVSGQATRDFYFVVDITQPSNPDTLFLIEFTTPGKEIDSAASTTTQKKSNTFQMTDGGTATLNMVITPGPGSNGNSLIFTASVKSVVAGVEVTTSTQTLTVQHS